MTTTMFLVISHSKIKTFTIAAFSILGAIWHDVSTLKTVSCKGIVYLSCTRGFVYVSRYTRKISKNKVSNKCQNLKHNQLCQHILFSGTLQKCDKSRHSCKLKMTEYLLKIFYFSRLSMIPQVN